MQLMANHNAPVDWRHLPDSPRGVPTSHIDSVGDNYTLDLALRRATHLLLFGYTAGPGRISEEHTSSNKLAPDRGRGLRERSPWY